MFETTFAGRRPLSDVALDLDGLYGLGVPTARTQTDSEGRDIFCGLGGETSTYLFARKGGYRGFEGTVELNGTSDTTFDIEFGQAGSRESDPRWSLVRQRDAVAVAMTTEESAAVAL